MRLLPDRRRASASRTSTTGADGSPEGATTNHIVAARAEFMGAFADLARGKRNWQLVAFGLAASLVLLALANLRLAASARVVPYVVEVDRLGQVAGAGAAERMSKPEDRLVASQLAQFVRAVRTVLPATAAAAQAEMLGRGYAFAAPEAAGFLNDHFSDPHNDPRVLGQRLAREVEVTAVLRVPNSDVWRLKWTETERPTQTGGEGRRSAWEGYLTVRLAPPTSIESAQDNPLGVYVTSISWTRLAHADAEPDADAQPPSDSRVASPDGTADIATDTGDVP